MCGAAGSMFATLRFRTRSSSRTAPNATRIAATVNATLEAVEHRVRALERARGVAELAELVRRLVRGERREHRQPERPADLLRRVEEARRQSGVLLADVGRRDQRDRDEEQAHADRLRDHRRQHVAQVRVVDEIFENR